MTDGRLADLTYVIKNNGYRTYTFSNLRETKYYHETSDNELVLEEDRSSIPVLHPEKCSNYDISREYVTEGTNVAGYEKVKIVVTPGDGWNEIIMSQLILEPYRYIIEFEDTELDYDVKCHPAAFKLLSEIDHGDVIEEFRTNNPGLEIPDDVGFALKDEKNFTTAVGKPENMLGYTYGAYSLSDKSGYIRFTDDKGRDVLVSAYIDKPYQSSYEETTVWSNTFTILVENNGFYDEFRIYSKELDVNKNWELGEYDEDVVKKYVKDHLKNINITITPID